MPTAISLTPACSRRNRMTFGIVAAGVEVGKGESCKSSGPVPKPQTNFVPPASMHPKRLKAILATGTSFTTRQLLEVEFGASSPIYLDFLFVGVAPRAWGPVLCLARFFLGEGCFVLVDVLFARALPGFGALAATMAYDWRIRCSSSTSPTASRRS